MNDVANLTALRERLVSRRRSVVADLKRSSNPPLTGETFKKVQEAIDAVDRAILDETRLAQEPANAKLRAAGKSLQQL